MPVSPMTSACMAVGRAGSSAKTLALSHYPAPASARACVRLVDFHHARWISEFAEAESLVQLMGVSRGQHQSSQPLQIRMLHDIFQQPFRHNSAAGNQLLTRDVDVFDTGVWRTGGMGSVGRPRASRRGERLL